MHSTIGLCELFDWCEFDNGSTTRISKILLFEKIHSVTSAVFQVLEDDSEND